MKGIISAVEKAGQMKDYSYIAITEKGPMKIKSEIIFNLLDKVEIDNSIGIFEKEVVKASKDDYNALVSNYISIKSKEFDVERARKNNERFEGLDELLPDMEKVAYILLKKMITGAPVVIRFHKDGDGGGGATALYKGVRSLDIDSASIFWRANRSIAYEEESFVEDTTLFSTYESVERPLLLIIDFGTSPTCYDRLLKATESFDVIMLDHHITFRDDFGEGKIFYISPWYHGGGSDITAGFMGAALSEIISKEDVELMKNVSLISDYSKYANREDQYAMTVSIVVDYLSAKKDYMDEFTPKQIENVVNDKDKLYEMAAFARNSIDDALGAGMNALKEYDCGFCKVFVLDFRHILENDIHYPAPGRFSSILHNYLEQKNGNNCVTIVYYERHVSMRGSKEIAEQLNFPERIQKLEKISTFIKSGGGHLNAAGIICEESKAGEVAKLMVAELSSSN